MITDNVFKQLKAPRKWNLKKFYESHLKEESSNDPQYYIRFDNPTEADRFWIDDLGYESKCGAAGSLYLRFGNEATRDNVVKELEDRGVENFTVGEGTRKDFVDYYKSLKESKTTDMAVPFEIKVSPRGAIGKATMMKVFKQILKEIPNSSRVGRTYFIKDINGFETCWWLEKNNYGELELSCELTEEETSVGKDRYNSITISYDRSTKRYEADYESHFVENERHTLKESKPAIKIVNIHNIYPDSEELDDDRITGTLKYSVTFAHGDDTWTDELSVDAVGDPINLHYSPARPTSYDPGEVDWEGATWTAVDTFDFDNILQNAPESIQDLSDEEYESLAYSLADRVEDLILENENTFLKLEDING